MSGHSKWANIQHRKGRQDAKRSNLWTKLVREIIVAARMGGGEPESNSRLRLALIKARAGNVPKDTIQNAILKGTGQLEGVSYEDVRYEGYGVGGAALIIDCTTDNRVRTVADVRHILSKNGGNLEVTCAPEQFDAVQKAFEAAGMQPEVAEITWKPLNETHLEGEEAARMQRLIDALEELDDVQQVYTSADFELPEEA